MRAGWSVFMLIGVLVVLSAAVLLSAQSGAQSGESGALRRLALPGEHDLGAVSPDGRFIAFKNDDEPNRRPNQLRDLAIREIATNAVRKVAVHTATERIGLPDPVAWSPDSKRVVYTWCEGTPSQRNEFRCDVRVAGVDGEERRIIVPRLDGSIHLFHWSPDGRHVLALIRASGRRIVLIDVTDGQLRDVNVSGQDSDDDVDFRSPAFSSDGRLIAYTRTRWQSKPYDSYLPGEVWIVDIDAGTDRVLIGGRDSVSFVAWTPSGTGVLFTSDRTGATDLWLAPIRNGSVAGEPSMVRSRVDPVIGRAMTTTGRLYFESPPDQSWDVQVADFDPIAGRATSAPRSIAADTTRRSSAPVWSTDGLSLAYRSAPSKPVPMFVTDGYDAITVRQMSTGVERWVRLQHSCLDQWHYWTFTWSRDPNVALLSVIGSVAACRGVYGVDLQTGQAGDAIKVRDRQIYHRDAQPLPGGLSLVFTRGTQSVVIADPATSEERTVLDLREPASGFEGGSVNALVLSHRGDRAIVMIGTRDKQSRLAELNLADGKLRVIQDEVGGWNTVAWTADDRSLLYFQAGTRTEPGEVWSVPVTGGRPEKIGLSIPSSDLLKYLSVRPDGRMLAFQREHSSEPGLFVLENFLPQPFLKRVQSPGGRE